MIDTLKDNKEWIELKATLKFVEDKILRIMDYQDWMMKKELEEQVKELLSDRHFIMNKMFRLHVTEQEVTRFRDVNDHLSELTRKMFSEHVKLLDSLKDNPILSVASWDDVVVESKLDVDEDAEVLRYDDDDDYGSNFSQMIDAIAWTEDLEIHSCYTTLGEKSEPDHLDNSSRWSWAEGCLDVPQFKGIGVCYAVHDLCTHKNYSVPDLLRIPSYSVLNTIKGSRKHIV
jgi:hypothetical protein